MRNILLGSIMLFAVIGCGNSILGGSGGDTIVGTWVNYGYSERLHFTISSTVDINQNGTFSVRERIKPTKESEGWIHEIIPNNTEEILIRYNGNWSTGGSGQISFQTDRRRLYFDGELSVGSVVDDENNFWNLTNTKDPFTLSIQILEGGDLLSISHDEDPSKPPMYFVFFNETKSVLFFRQ